MSENADIEKNPGPVVGYKLVRRRTQVRLDDDKMEMDTEEDEEDLGLAEI